MDRPSTPRVSAGAAAEELIFGDVSTGAQDDLQRATDLARHMVTRFGMSEAFGVVVFEQRPQSVFPADAMWCRYSLVAS